MTALFFLLILAHVLGDFVFQTNTIYRLKIKHFWGILLHVLFFFLFSLLFMFPLSFTSLSFFFWLVFISITHVIFDKIKLVFHQNIIQKELQYFLVDQIAHIAMIATIFLFPFAFPVDIALGSPLYNLFAKIGLSYDLASFTNIVFILSVLVYSSYAIGVILYYYERSVDKDLDKLDYKIIPMLYRSVVVYILTTPVFYLSLIIIVVKYFISKWRLVFDKRYYFIESSLLLLIAAIYYFVKGTMF